jgi:hypothetical protein
MYYLSVLPHSPSLCLLKNVFADPARIDDKVDGILANIDEAWLNPPFSPLVSFIPSKSISERQRIVGRRRENRIGVTQLQLKFEKMKKK